VPVLYGDVVLDRKKSFCVLSGDQIASYLALKLKAEKIIFAIDVDGIYDKDPKKFKNAKLLSKISGPEILNALESPQKDVTLGIKGKLSELIKLAEKGIESQVVNGLKAGRLRKALKGERVIGTTIKF
jgi:isopentenyl phosphate kinase